nr:hypothetical protein [Tanacetum cinerariifolium]
MNLEQQQASSGRSLNEAAILRVCRGVGYGMVRDCRELIADLAGKHERYTVDFKLWCREAQKSPDSSPTKLKPSQNQESIKVKKIQTLGTKIGNP